VHTGVRALAFTSLALDQGQFDVDINLWFRHRAEVPAEDVVLLNAAAGPQPLGAPVSEQVEDGVRYHAYRMSLRLAPDYFPQPYGRRLLGLSMRHRTLPRHRLLYARDQVGSAVATARTADERLQQLYQLLDPDTGWAIKNVEFFQDTTLEHSIGHPDYLDQQNKAVVFSRYNIGLIVEKRGVTLRGLLPPAWSLRALVASAVVSVLLLAAGVSARVRRFVKTRFVLQLVASIALLVSGQVMFAPLGHW